MKIHRVIYTDADRLVVMGPKNKSTATDIDTSTIWKPDTSTVWKQGETDTSIKEADTSIKPPEHFHSENAKSLNGQPKGAANILRDIRDIRREEVIGVEVGRDCAEARLPMKAGRWNSERANSYLSEVEASLSDEVTRSAVQYECRVLSEIVDDYGLPESIRVRASNLRASALGS